MNSRNKLTTKEFIEISVRFHGDKYDYSKSKYINSRSKVTIICKKHGDFEQRANVHMHQSGCRKCGLEIVSSSTEKFIQKSIKIHGDTYDYSKVEYKGSFVRVKIGCKKHGYFSQSPHVHLSGSICKKCSDSNRKHPLTWRYSDWQEAGDESKLFDSFKVYIIKCWNEEEEFYKIGKTFTTVEYRFRNKRQMPYNYEIVKVIIGEARDISKLEKELQKINKDNKYLPNINFGGASECFNTIKKND